MLPLLKPSSITCRKTSLFCSADMLPLLFDKLVMSRLAGYILTRCSLCSLSAVTLQ